MSPRLRLVLSLFLAVVVTLPALRLLHAPRRELIANALARRAVRSWTNEHAADGAMRGVNPEWDFMARTFTVLALASRIASADESHPAASATSAGLSADGPARAESLAAIDAILDDTIATAAREGQTHFMLRYASARPFVDPEAASLFVDGELVMMIAARELVAPGSRYMPEARRRAARIERTMRRSPTLSGESYPDECWTFCNTTALAGLSLLDRVDGSDHRALADAWVAFAKGHLVDPSTGLLVSSFTRDGTTLDGPEGSSLWMSAHALSFIDEDFAKDQYARARKELGRTFLGFGWAREWPVSTRAPRVDVDSGPIVPLLEASAGSSGLALLGASAFGDTAYGDALVASLDLAAVPSADGYRASNAVGDAVTLYAFSEGSLRRRAHRQAVDR